MGVAAPVTLGYFAQPIAVYSDGWNVYESRRSSFTHDRVHNSPSKPDLEASSGLDRGRRNEGVESGTLSRGNESIARLPNGVREGGTGDPKVEAGSREQAEGHEGDRIRMDYGSFEGRKWGTEGTPLVIREEDAESSGLLLSSYVVQSLTDTSQDECPVFRAFKYKPVAKKVRPVATDTPAEFRVERRMVGDPLADLPQLPVRPPEWEPGERLTRERGEKFDWDPGGFLWPEELKLVKWLVRAHETAFAWDASERGTFREDIFPPLKIPTVPHKPWVYRNIPIPPAIYSDVVGIIKEKIAAGVYEPSTSSYRSRWFCVVKKDGKSLRLVHDLQPLNAVSIQDSAVPPHVDSIAEAFAGHAVFGMYDLMVGYDHRVIHEDYRDLTTFQTPIGTFRLTKLPMGYTNAVQVFHGDVSFTLQDETPEVTMPFIDDIPVKGPRTRYPKEKGTYETIEGNPGIRRFIWEHLENSNRVLQRIKYVGGTVSAKKFVVAAPSIVVVGHKVSFEGRVPDESKVQKIRDWPYCTNVTEVRGFLGLCSYCRIFIKDFAKRARPLIELTKKGTFFRFEEEHEEAMDDLKDALVHSPALRPIDYKSGRRVILAVDTSHIAVGYLLLQIGEDGKRYPSRFGSIALNERESRYSQAKLELFGLFRALRDVRNHIFGVKDLAVEVDAKYIKGMINNPDLQPNASINRWIAGILLFEFELIHVPAERHKGPDGLSRRPRAGEDPIEDDEYEDWIDEVGAFAIEALNPQRGAKPETYFEQWGSNRPIHGSLFEEREWTKGMPRGMVATQVVSSQNERADTSPDVEIPRTQRGKEKDERLEHVQRLLETSERPSGLTGSQFEALIRYATRFFVKDGELWHREPKGKHQLVPPYEKRLDLMRQAHDGLGHKGAFSTKMRLLISFWWPSISSDVQWFVRTCHECQIRRMDKLHIPPVVAMPEPLFYKAYMDSMNLPKSSGFRYIVQARCSLTAYPEWQMLRSETGKVLGKFIFEQILCRWGAVGEIVTDNGSAFVQALDFLASTYKINHIRISPYNSQANGIVERRHLTVREALVKTCEGDMTKWANHAAYVFWAERVTIAKSTKLSPYQMVHGVEPRLPFDFAEATFLTNWDEDKYSTEELITHRCRQLERRKGDLERVRDQVYAARCRSAKEFEARVKGSIREYEFAPGDLVLVRNTRIEKELDRKTKPRYLGPMVVLRKTRGGAYLLAELDGSISRLRYAAFRLLPYFSRSRVDISIFELTGRTEAELLEIELDSIDDLAGQEENYIDEDEREGPGESI